MQYACQGGPRRAQHVQTLVQVFDVMYVRRDSTRNSGVRAEGGLCPHQMFLENHARADERQDEGATQILHDVHANLKELDKRHAERTGVRWPECPRPCVCRGSRQVAGIQSVH